MQNTINKCSKHTQTHRYIYIRRIIILRINASTSQKCSFIRYLIASKLSISSHRQKVFFFLRLYVCASIRSRSRTSTTVILSLYQSVFYYLNILELFYLFSNAFGDFSKYAISQKAQSIHRSGVVTNVCESAFVWMCCWQISNALHDMVYGTLPLLFLLNAKSNCRTH